MNYLKYPMKNMKITQTYDGGYSHFNSSHGTPRDYPIDEAGKDSGREYFYCPCDEMVVKKIYGIVTGKTSANGAWLESTSECDFADVTRDYATVKFVHMNDSDFGDDEIYVGKIYKRGEAIGREGTSGNATGNHVHITAGKGKMKGSGWEKNDKGAWVLTTTKGTFKPEELFFVDESFTSVIKSSGLSFKNLPKPKFTMKDAVIAMQAVSKLIIPTEEQTAKYDLDKDGHITMSDAVSILQEVSRFSD